MADVSFEHSNEIREIANRLISIGTARSLDSQGELAGVILQGAELLERDNPAA
jgi:hypothetical protein